MKRYIPLTSTIIGKIPIMYIFFLVFQFNRFVSSDNIIVKVLSQPRIK